MILIKNIYFKFYHVTSGHQFSFGISFYTSYMCMFFVLIVYYAAYVLYQFLIMLNDFILVYILHIHIFNIVNLYSGKKLQFSMVFSNLVFLLESIYLRLLNQYYINEFSFFVLICLGLISGIYLIVKNSFELFICSRCSGLV